MLTAKGNRSWFPVAATEGPTSMVRLPEWQVLALFFTQEVFSYHAYFICTMVVRQACLAVTRPAVEPQSRGLEVR